MTYDVPGVEVATENTIQEMDSVEFMQDVVYGFDDIDYHGLYGWINMPEPYDSVPSYLYYHAISKGHPDYPYSEMEMDAQMVQQIEKVGQKLSFCSDIDRVSEYLSKSQIKLMRATVPDIDQDTDVDHIIDYIEDVVERLCGTLRMKAMPYARRNFAYFVFMCNPLESPTSSTHLIYLAETAQGVVEGRLSNRMLVSIAPGTAKTQTMSVKFSTWFAGRFPKKRVLVLSYNETFIKKEIHPFLMTVLESEWYQTLFPKAIVNTKRSTSEKTAFLNGLGSISMRSVGQGIAGVRGHLCITDDLYATYQDATSPTMQKRVLDWLLNDVMPRMLPNMMQVMVNARWSANDVQAMMIQRSTPGTPEYQEVGAFEIVELPVKAVSEDDPLGRGLGELIWPQYYDDDHYRMLFSDMDDTTISTQYYCRPTDGGTSAFTREFIMWYRKYPKQKGVDYTGTYLSIDTANTAKERSDDTVMSVWRNTPDGNYYLIDIAYGKWDILKIQEEMLRLIEEYDVTATIIEDAGIATAIKTTCDAKRGFGKILLVPHNNKSKGFRFNQCLPAFEDGKIFMPQAKGLPWMQQMMLELLNFPNYASDNFVDSISLAINWMENKGLRSDPARFKQTRC